MQVWSKTERMNCERALLSFGFGRWGRIKEGAQGGTRLREESEIASFATAFVCLCVGVPVGTVGQLAAPGAAADAASGITPGGEAELEGIGKARELLQQMGCELPSLSKAMVRTAHCTRPNAHGPLHTAQCTRPHNCPNCCRWRSSSRS